MFNRREPQYRAHATCRQRQLLLQQAQTRALEADLFGLYGNINELGTRIRLVLDRLSQPRGDSHCGRTRKFGVGEDEDEEPSNGARTETETETTDCRHCTCLEGDPLDQLMRDVTQILRNREVVPLPPVCRCHLPKRFGPTARGSFDTTSPNRTRTYDTCERNKNAATARRSFDTTSPNRTRTHNACERNKNAATENANSDGAREEVSRGDADNERIIRKLADAFWENAGRCPTHYFWRLHDTDIAPHLHPYVFQTLTRAVWDYFDGPISRFWSAPWDVLEPAGFRVSLVRSTLQRWSSRRLRIDSTNSVPNPFNAVHSTTAVQASDDDRFRFRARVENAKDVDFGLCELPSPSPNSVANAKAGSSRDARRTAYAEKGDKRVGWHLH